LPEESRKITLRIHNWIRFTESAVFCRQEVDNCRSSIVFTQHQVALTDAVLYNMAACKHVWDSFSTNSDHASRSRDRGALYQLYLEQPLTEHSPFQTPCKIDDRQQ